MKLNSFIPFSGAGRAAERDPEAENSTPATTLNKMTDRDGQRGFLRSTGESAGRGSCEGCSNIIIAPNHFLVIAASALRWDSGMAFCPS